jgi:hypothetical protein
MLPVLVSLLICLRASLRTRVALQAEVLALRHQLLVLQRRHQKQRVRLSIADRLFWVWLSRVWADWRSALRIVKPETVIAWHRKGFRLYWSWKSRARQGRPSVSVDVRELIRRMSAANPRWGAPRIHGELGKLGIKVSETTVAKYMVRRRNPPSQTWRTFLANHVKDLASADFFVEFTRASKDDGPLADFSGVIYGQSVFHREVLGMLRERGCVHFGDSEALESEPVSPTVSTASHMSEKSPSRRCVLSVLLPDHEQPGSWLSADSW